MAKHEIEFEIDCDCDFCTGYRAGYLRAVQVEKDKQKKAVTK